MRKGSVGDGGNDERRRPRAVIRFAADATLGLCSTARAVARGARRRGRIVIVRPVNGLRHDRRGNRSRDLLGHRGRGRDLWCGGRRAGSAGTAGGDGGRIVVSAAARAGAIGPLNTAVAEQARRRRQGGQENDLVHRVNPFRKVAVSSGECGVAPHPVTRPPKGSGDRRSGLANGSIIGPVDATSVHPRRRLPLGDTQPDPAPGSGRCNQDATIVGSVIPRANLHGGCFGEIFRFLWIFRLPKMRSFSISRKMWSECSHFRFSAGHLRTF